MKRFLKRLFISLGMALALSGSISLSAADGDVLWSMKVKDLGNSTFELVFTGKINTGWHIYDVTQMEGGPNATMIAFNSTDGFTTVGGPYILSNNVHKVYDDMFEMEIAYIEGTAVIGQKIRLTKPSVKVSGYIEWQSCNDYACLPLGEWEFSTELKSEAVAVPQIQEPRATNQPIETDAVANVDNDTDAEATAAIDHENIADPETTTATSSVNMASSTPDALLSMRGDSDNRSLWALIVEAVLWGLMAFLTPCVFPMAPMTVSYFMKGSENKAKGRFRASMYGIIIILLYTVPIALLILVSLVVGGTSVTADIFNWMSTHWLPNIMFFIVFIVFAASFFGAFELTLPSKWTNRTDSRADSKGLGGVFFMALTLVLVSFSCTGPIVGSVLIKATQGGAFWTPVITMFAFAVTFALPFTILAFFPSLLNKLKSGSWLNSVKIVLGFIEVAFAFKFLSMADQAYRWRLLDREIYLAIWIVIFMLLGIYLLGKLKFKHDSDVKFISIPRLTLAIISFTFATYMIPGLWGAPLKGLSGYIPPITTQDFILDPNMSSSSGSQTTSDFHADKKLKYEDLVSYTHPFGLHSYFDFEEALEASRIAGKPLFVDFTGHACNNCREMETKVWSDQEVQKLLKNEFVMVSLFGDNKKDVPEEDWVTLPSGRVLKGLGKINSNFVNERFGVIAQPTYIITDNEGNMLVPPVGYMPNVPKYIEFLRSGIEAFHNQANNNYGD